MVFIGQSGARSATSVPSENQYTDFGVRKRLSPSAFLDWGPDIQSLWMIID